MVPGCVQQVQEGKHRMIFIAGASGFVGHHLVDHLIARKSDIAGLARSERAAKALASRGCRVVQGDITRPESLRNVLQAGDSVIHLVGIIEERGSATFQSIHVEGTRNLIAEAKRAGVRHFFYQSALGADAGSWSGYLRTKAAAEEIVKASGLPCTIFRPSLIIGPWDGFTKKMMALIRMSPVLPIPGEGRAKFQPIYIKDWLACIDKVLASPGDYPSTYDIGGPEQLAYRQIVAHLAEALNRSRPMISVPMGLMKLSSSILGAVLRNPPVTLDQLRLLEQDNICDPDAVERHFGFRPMRYVDALREFIPG